MAWEREGEVPAFRFTYWTPGMIANLPQPRTAFGLDLSGSVLTDVGLKELARLKSLQSLNLEHTQITDAGLKELAGLNCLQSLNINDTQVTPAGLKALTPLKHLSSLYLNNAVVELQPMMPSEDVKTEPTTKKQDESSDMAKPRAIEVLFPLEGVTLGKTTVDELATLGTRPDKTIFEGIWDKYYIVKGIWFQHNDKTAEYKMHLVKCRLYTMPVPWQKLGFDFDLSYDGWLRLFANLGWNVKVLQQPRMYKHDHLRHKSLQATIQVTSGDIELKLNFDYGEDKTTSDSGTLYSLDVETKERSTQDIRPGLSVPEPIAKGPDNTQDLKWTSNKGVDEEKLKANIKAIIEANRNKPIQPQNQLRFQGFDDGVIRAIVVHEGMRLPLLAIAATALVDPAKAQRMASDFETVMFSDTQEKAARKALDQNDRQDYEGRLAITYTFWLLLSQVPDEDRRNILNGPANEAAKNLLLAEYARIRNRYATKCEQSFRKISEMGSNGR